MTYFISARAVIFSVHYSCSFIDIESYIDIIRRFVLQARHAYNFVSNNFVGVSLLIFFKRVTFVSICHATKDAKTSYLEIHQG